MSLKRSGAVKGEEKYAKRSYIDAKPVLKTTRSVCFSAFRIHDHKTGHRYICFFRDVVGSKPGSVASVFRDLCSKPGIVVSISRGLCLKPGIVMLSVFKDLYA